MRAWRRGLGRWWGKSEEEDDGQAQQAPAAMEQDALAPAMLRSPAPSQQRIGDRLDSTPALLLHSIASVGIWDIHGPHAMPTVFPALGSGIWIRRREDRNDSDLQQLVPSLYGLFLRPSSGSTF